MDNIKKAIEEAKCTVALDENDEMVTLDEPRYYFTKDGLFTLLEMGMKKAYRDGVANEACCKVEQVDMNGWMSDNYWQQTLKALTSPSTGNKVLKE